MKLQKLHPWHITPKEAIELQSDLAKRLFFPPLPLDEISLVAGATIVYSKTSHIIYGSVVVMDFAKMKVVEIQTGQGLSDFPALPGLHGFREIPILCHLFEKLEHQPDVIIYEGEGIAHQRGFGVASHLGLWLDVPTIGCSKTKMLGEFKEPGKKSGAWNPLTYQKDVVGAVLRTKATQATPLFVSPGYKIDLDSSLSVVQNSLARSDVPEPLRQARQAAEALEG